MTYDEMFTAWQLGQITREEWDAFCFELLVNIMEENRDVFERLKNS